METGLGDKRGVFRIEFPKILCRYRSPTSMPDLYTQHNRDERVTETHGGFLEKNADFPLHRTLTYEKTGVSGQYETRSRRIVSPQITSQFSQMLQKPSLRENEIENYHNRSSREYPRKCLENRHRTSLPDLTANRGYSPFKTQQAADPSTAGKRMSFDGALIFFICNDIFLT